MLSGMQRAGSALAHIANSEGLAFDVVFVDTGVLHHETLSTRTALASTHKHLRVVTLQPSRDMARQYFEDHGSVVRALLPLTAPTALPLPADSWTPFPSA